MADATTSKSDMTYLKPWYRRIRVFGEFSLSIDETRQKLRYFAVTLRKPGFKFLRRNT